MMQETDAAIVGAGPYGLAIAAHLRARGREVTVVGEPMSYWAGHMPAGMRLRSSWRASSIASPGERFSLGAYERAIGRELDRPVPLADFLAYGHWYREHAVGPVEHRRVAQIARANGGFRLALEDGGELTARRVVLATGLERFGHRPDAFAGLPAELASHSGDHPDPRAFAGRRLLVVGAGQSAIELAALARAAGADVTVLTRAPAVRWLLRSARLHGAAWGTGRVLYAPTDVGPAGLSWAVAAPGLMRRLPARLRDRASARCVRPAASHWLKEPLAGAPFVSGAEVRRAEPGGAGARVHLDDGRTLEAEHIVLGTGFAPSLERAAILEPGLHGRVQTRDGLPVLGRGFETSVPGLHVVGALSIGSFGPVVRFVSGTWYTAPAVAAAVARRSRHAS